MIRCSTAGVNCQRFWLSCIQRIISSHCAALPRCCVISFGEWQATQLFRTSSQSPVLMSPVAGSMAGSASAWPDARSTASMMETRIVYTACTAMR